MKEIKNINNILAIILIVTPLIILPLYPHADYFYLPKITFIYMALTVMIGIHILSPDRKKIELDTVTKVLLIFLFLVFLSTLFSVDFYKSLMGNRGREEGFLAILAYGLLFLFAKNYYRFEKWHLYGIFISIFLVTSYAFIQFFGYDFIPRDIIRDGTRWASYIFSTMGNPNFFGSYLVLMLPLAITVFFKTNKKVTIPIYMLALMLFSAILMTTTRSSWLAFIFITIIYLIYIKIKNLNILKYLLLIGGFIIVFFIFNHETEQKYSKRAATIKEDVNAVFQKKDNYQRAGSSRFFVWGKTIELIKEKPLIGYGPESMDPLFINRFSDEMKENIGHPQRFDRAHNEYLHIAFSSGIIALLTYLLLLVLSFKNGWSYLKKEPLYWPIIVAIAAYLIQAFFNISVVAVAYIFWIFLGLLNNPAVFSKSVK